MGGGEKIAFLIDKGFGICHKARRSAGVAELVDAPDSKSGEGDLVSVRFRSSVFKEHFKCEVLFISERILCRGGGTGRRTRLKIWRGRPRIGSIPILGIQRALQMRSALFFWLLRDRFCDVAVWGGGRGKKNEQNHRDAVLKRIGATWSCVDRIFFRLIAVI